MRSNEQQADVHAEAHVRGRGRRQGNTLRDRIVISTTIIGVALFVLVGAPLLKPHVRTQIEAARDYPERPDRDRELVRSWLRSQYPGLQIREIRWWLPRDLVALHRRQLEEAREEARDDPDMDELVDELEQNGPDRVCRLRYRVPDEAGALVSHEDLFVMRNGQVRRYREDSSAYRVAMPYFADDDGSR